ncbi:hypothetical protein BDN72DRAFT_778272, partial [Pluteus cervinus]
LEWHQVHGQFAQMGGFALKVKQGNHEKIQVLYPETLIRHLENKQIDIEELKLTKEEVQDKSKGDFLSKSLVAFQTTWFVCECVARSIHKLPLLELEVVTLAFAILNIITYMLWRHKPLDVFCPIYLHLLEPKVLASSLQPHTVPDLSGPSRDASIGSASTPPGVDTPTTPNPPRDGDDSPSAEDLDLPHVTVFYGSKISGENERIVWIFSCIIGMIFGAIHFLSWDSTFRTHSELLLWRCSSIVLVIQPFLLLIVKVLSWIPNTGKWKLWQAMAERFSDVPLFLSLYIGTVAYILARFCLLVLAFLSLLDLPPNGLKNVSWASYIPHF